MKLLLTLTLTLFTLLSFSQEYLYLKKKGTTKMKALVLYQKASVKDKVTRKWTKGTVTKFSDSTITINALQYKFEDLEAIRFGNNGWKFLGSSFKAGGVLFGGIVLVNGLINSDSFDQMSTPLAVAVGMYGAGWIFDWISRRGYTLEKYRVEYIRIN
jgi:hypothetical protein